MPSIVVEIVYNGGQQPQWAVGDAKNMDEIVAAAKKHPAFQCVRIYEFKEEII